MRDRSQRVVPKTLIHGAVRDFEGYGAIANKSTVLPLRDIYLMGVPCQGCIEATRRFQEEIAFVVGAAVDSCNLW